jgi:hypothetical protein
MSTAPAHASETAGGPAPAAEVRDVSAAEAGDADASGELGPVLGAALVLWLVIVVAVAAAV